MSNNDPLEAGVLPEGLEYMVLVVFPAPFKPGCFPNSLKTLLMHDGYDHKIPTGALPLNGNLKRIVMEHWIQQTFERGFFPNGLLHLQLLQFDTPVQPGVLPPCLTHLDLGLAFNQVLVPGALPASLKFPPLRGFVPASVTHLSFLYQDSINSKLSIPITNAMIPNTVRHLRLPAKLIPGLDESLIEAEIEHGVHPDEYDAMYTICPAWYEEGNPATYGFFRIDY